MRLNLVEYVLVVCLLCAFWIYNGAVVSGRDANHEEGKPRVHSSARAVEAAEARERDANQPEGLVTDEESRQISQYLADKYGYTLPEQDANQLAADVREGFRDYAFRDGLDAGQIRKWDAEAALDALVARIIDLEAEANEWAAQAAAEHRARMAAEAQVAALTQERDEAFDLSKAVDGFLDVFILWSLFDELDL